MTFSSAPPAKIRGLSWFHAPKTLVNYPVMIVAQNKSEPQIEVPIDSPIVPKPNLPLSPYDYFALLPTLIAAATPFIVAATPLILGLKQKRSDRDRKDCLKPAEKDDDDAHNSEKKPSKKDDDLVS